MSAKEMFEKLGYELEKGYEYLKYTQVSKETNNLEYYIEFDSETKTILIDCNRKDFTSDINIKELDAINKQVDELNWK